MYLPGLIGQYDGLNVTKSRVAVIMQHKKRTDMQSR